MESYNAACCLVRFVGFTAWASARSPTEVFLLLETIYAAFDKLASTYGVFKVRVLSFACLDKAKFTMHFSDTINRYILKVETGSDHYVAVSGVPEPRKDHAVVVAKFAMACMRKMKVLTPKLEVTLGLVHIEAN